VGFEPTIPAFEKAKTVHALDRAATLIGTQYPSIRNSHATCSIFITRFTVSVMKYCHSQWPRRLRHELSSLSRTLGSWVRIPLNAWMPVCAFILCLCQPCDGLMTRPRSPIICVKMITKLKNRPGPNKGL
jgi:hypothetical protein